MRRSCVPISQTIGAFVSAARMDPGRNVVNRDLLRNLGVCALDGGHFAYLGCDRLLVLPGMAISLPPTSRFFRFWHLHPSSPQHW